MQPIRMSDAGMAVLSGPVPHQLVPVAEIVVVDDPAWLKLRVGGWGLSWPGYSSSAFPKLTPLKLATATAHVNKPWLTVFWVGGQLPSGAVAEEGGLPPCVLAGTARLKLIFPFWRLTCAGGKAGLLFMISDSSAFTENGVTIPATELTRALTNDAAPGRRAQEIGIAVVPGVTVRTPPAICPLNVQLG